MLQQRVEESVRRHTESSLVECHKGDLASLYQRGGHGILGHVPGEELHRRHEPLAHEILQVLLHNHEAGLVLLRHFSRGKEKQHSLNPKYFSFCFSSFFRCKEEDEKATIDCERGLKHAHGRLFPFIAP
jgi:hypothetical protein